MIIFLLTLSSRIGDQLEKDLVHFYFPFPPPKFIFSRLWKRTKKENNNNQLTVYTTVYPLQYFTEQIGGKYVVVDTVYPPGADEHTFEPTQKDMMKLVDADLFFYIGLGLEGFVNKAKETLKNEDVTLVATAEGLSLEESEAAHTEEADAHGEADEHGHTVDPHVWIDPVYAQELAKSIKDALIEKMPDQKDTFEKNYQTLVEELNTLDQSFKKMVKDANRKEIIVAHSAYGYWESRYGIKQISIFRIINNE
nr:zinc ABC transporter substrate-binding protein [Bacillus sp. T3]